jgi:hypothetical protein
MRELTIGCPKCQTEIPLTETLARPLLDAERAAIGKREQDVKQNELRLATLQNSLNAQAADVEQEVQLRLSKEHEQIRLQTVEKEQARNKLVLDAKDKELANLNVKLGEAQKAELEMRRERQALQQEKEAMNLEVARQVDQERQRVRETTQKEEAERYEFKLSEREHVIEGLKKTITELQRKSEQGSQQLQGEVQELALESVLRAAFPKDEIAPVPAGRNGGDVLQKVIGPSGLVCGTILWESKRTKLWSDAWLAKNREDQRIARAHVGVIVSEALPRNVDTFDRLDDVWVTSFSCAIPLAKALRQALVQAALLQLAGHDREGKTDRMYIYITGQEFKRRVSTILEGYTSLCSELEREKRSVTAAWARRQKCHELVLGGTAGLYGDLHGILGESMPEVQGLERPQPEALPPAPGESLEPPAQRRALLKSAVEGLCGHPDCSVQAEYHCAFCNERFCDAHGWPDMPVMQGEKETISMCWRCQTKLTAHAA